MDVNGVHKNISTDGNRCKSSNCHRDDNNDIELLKLRSGILKNATDELKKAADSISRFSNDESECIMVSEIFKLNKIFKLCTYFLTPKI